MSTLYVVATPIGNLEDITLRAIRVLREVDLIASEDTRVTRKLLSRYGIDTPQTSYHEHNRRAKLSKILSVLSEKDVALASDAGTPGINDPGAELVAAAAQEGHSVVPIPGASAVTSAIAVSGLNITGFLYLGYLPRKRADCKDLLESVKWNQRVIVALESPHRLNSALSDLLATLGDRRIVVCREMTKLHEEVFRGTVSESITYFRELRGEFTLVIEGAVDVPASLSVDDGDVIKRLAQLRADGARAKEVVSRVAIETGLSKRRVYQLWLTAKRDSGVVG